MSRPPKRAAGTPLPDWANPVWRADWYRFLMHEADMHASHRGIIAFTGTRAHRDYGGSWEAHDTTAKAMGCSERTVGSALAEGVRRGYLGRARRKHDSNIYWPTMPARFGGVWPKQTDLERQLIADLKCPQDQQPIADQVGQERQSIAEGVRQPIAEESLLRTPLSDENGERHHHHHLQQHEAQASDWPSAPVVDQARLLCSLARIEPTPALLATANEWLPKWRQDHTWAAVQIGVLTTVLNKPGRIHSFSYFKWEVPKAHAQQVEYGQDFDAEAIVRHFAKQIADRAAGMEAAA